MQAVGRSMRSEMHVRICPLIGSLPVVPDTMVDAGAHYSTVVVQAIM